MFADSLLESSLVHDSHRGWTTLISFGVQAFVVGILLLIPLYYTGVLPQTQTTFVRYIPPALPSMPVFHAVQRSGPLVRSASDLSIDGHMVEPQSIPTAVAQIVESSPPGPVDISALSGPNTGTSGTGGGNRDGVPGGLGNNLNAVAPPPPVAHPPRVSRMMEGNLIYRVQPVYPALARQARIQGAVILHAVISRDGSIQNLQVISGHPMLSTAAMDAVKQWRYRPYMLNGEPVEVDTQVTVNFLLSGG